ncbi:iron-containing alcohol dehydrogenase [Ornithinicoccus halotolerans]|uniref:iron-containing alcohol dehydrogenase n=1 Tax=Ornithinicoccus halotolerans TaxID=1748220 RepID=UPI001885E292|nr:iron-containing alcohol dehydrogenase [Ornithinicoccus halotolerans]
MAATTVTGFPGSYLQGPGVLARLPAELPGGNGWLVVVDATVARHHPDALAALTGSPRTGEVVEVDPACTEDAVRRLGARAARSLAPGVVGVGGGSVLDLAKGAALHAGVEVACAPSAASSDAPTSRRLVLYDEDHRLLGPRVLPRGPVVVAADTTLMATAPVRLLRAGMGDALSKADEARQVAASGGRALLGGAPSRLALMAAEAIEPTLREHGPGALRHVQAARRGADDAVAGTSASDTAESAEADAAGFEQVVEATTLWSGVAFEACGLSLAHALTWGLSRLPGAAGALHGEQVALGLLVQLHATGAPPERLAEVTALYDALGLPRSPADLGLPPLTDADADAVVEGTLASPHARHTTPRVTAGRLRAALEALETGPLVTGSRQEAHP